MWREGDAADDFSAWSFLPSFNVHFFRRISSIDDYLAIEATLNPAHQGANGAAKPQDDSVGAERASALPDGIVTFLMTDVVESTPLWLRSRAQMYVAMKRHDQLLSAAIEANGGVVSRSAGKATASLRSSFAPPTRSRRRSTANERCRRSRGRTTSRSAFGWRS